MVEILKTFFAGMVTLLVLIILAITGLWSIIIVILIVYLLGMPVVLLVEHIIAKIEGGPNA